MRIMIVTESFRAGGKERRLTELLKHFDSMDHLNCQVIILKNIIEYSEIQSLKKIKVRILKRIIRKDPTIFFRLFKIVRRFKPQIVHSWGPMPSVYAAPIAWLLRIKFVNAMITNAYLKPFSKIWFRAKLTFPFSNRIVSNSNAGLTAYQVPSGKGQVIYNGFDFKRTHNLMDITSVKKSMNISTPQVVGMVGVFHDRKDYCTFFNAAQDIIRKNTEVSFIALGDGPNYEYFKASVPLELKQKILLPGLIHEVEQVINCFDIGVLLTNTLVHREGISNAILEYMALSKPVIATRSGGTEEVIVHMKNGILIEPFAVDEFEYYVLKLLKEKELRIELGSNAKKSVITRFSIREMVNTTLKLYNSLIEY